MTPLAAGAVARDLSTDDCQVTCSTRFNTCCPGADCISQSREDMAVGLVEQSQVLAAFVAQHDCVHQTARPGHNRRAAAGPPQNGDMQPIADRDVNFLRDARRPANYGQRLWRLPKSQDFMI